MIPHIVEFHRVAVDVHALLAAEDAVLEDLEQEPGRGLEQYHFPTPLVSSCRPALRPRSARADGIPSQIESNRIGGGKKRATDGGGVSRSCGVARFR
uniref:Cl55281_1 n=1 Tax=Arundo donax TaxID=35708 RepID=A0A0A9ERM0_ARUDO